MPIDPSRVQAVFLAAVASTDPAERGRVLEELCAGDAGLRARVEALLQAHDQSGELPPIGQGNVAGEGRATVIDSATASAGRMIAGRYRLLEEIGEGGMGTVWAAEQLQPVRRRVAIKLIKPGMDSRQVLSRFEVERQALALMEHPNIAKVLDGGVTDQGHPYFVMEYVKGMPITDYCDRARVTIEERLKLFMQVCQAVQHAHQKGIIHRDLKPSNILVCLYDGRPVPKVIDFGLAKAINQPLTEHTLYTAHGVMVGTPLYMSPEQAEFNNLDIDTRSDIYSLGVVLYELLTGTTPLDRQRIKSAIGQEIVRLIKEEEPSKPSTKLSGSGSLPSVAAQRNLEPAQLTRLVRGDLDWIVMKSLEKDRNRRYTTTGAFAEDIERYLRNETITARPPSTSYRLKKLVQRNRAAVLTAVAMAVALIAGTAVATWQAMRATRAEKDALAREAETKAMLSFVEDHILAAARPEGLRGGLGREVTLRKAIESALPFVKQSFPDQPLIEARLRLTLGQSFYDLGDDRKAAEQEEAAYALFSKLLGSDHPDTLMAMNHLGTCYGDLGRYDDALKLRETTLALRKARLGPNHPDTLISMNNLANSYYDLGRHAEALALREETLALDKATLGPDHRDTLACMFNIANAYRVLGRRAEALKLYEETLALFKAKLGPDHPETLVVMHGVASAYYGLGRSADSLKLYEETLTLDKAKLGPDHPDTLRVMNDLAGVYADVGRSGDALKLREQTLHLIKGKYGPDHPATLTCMANLANSYATIGRHAEALKLREEALAVRKTKLGPDHASTRQSTQDVAASLLAVHRRADAAALIRQAVAIPEKPNRTDPGSLYNAACFRAVAAGMLRAADTSPSAAKEADVEADRAMAWLKQAVSAGYKNAAHIKEDRDLDALRARDDFKQLVAELQRAKPSENAKP
ncbi:MAG TPA: serine/threonine-protein kinase [Planctomycetaceae bacterium]|nr:serine/threonine-protein kinase [Planctomycetaceae bacterium]